MKRTISVLLVCLMMCFYSSNIYGYTEDDVRDLLGKERVDGVFTQSEINMIVEQYEKIERANLYLKMFERVKDLTINDELIEEYKKLESELEIAHSDLAKSFQGGSNIDIVLKDKSKLESLLHRISNMKKVGYSINVEYLPNIWEDKYLQVQNIVNQLNDQFEIGYVGNGLKIPLDSSMSIEYPYGLRLNETEDALYMNEGIGFRAKIGTMVLSQWNGIVERIYNGSVGKTVEIRHGNSLKTVYKNVGNVKVSVGEKVSQYQVIGELLRTSEDNLNGVLHLEVYIDGESVNPIYLYGEEGLKSFKTFVSLNPEDYMQLLDIEKIIKNEPTKQEENNEIEEKSNTSYFNIDEFYENMLREKEEKERVKNGGLTDLELEEREEKKQEDLKEILGL